MGCFKLGKVIFLLKVALLFFAISLFFVASHISLAQETDSTGVKIQPSIIDEQIKPGETYEGVFRVTNISTTKKTYYLLKKDIKGLTPEGTPIFAEEGEEKTGFEVSEWISFAAESIDVEPDEIGEVGFTISVPEDATPGSHFGGVFANLQPPRLLTIGSGIGFEVGSIVTIKVPGDIVDEARIREFSTDKIIYGKPTVIFTTRVENLGNVVVRARGPLEVLDIFGKQVALLRINETGTGILPGGQRGYQVTWEGEGLKIGRFQGIVSLVYGDDQKKTISSILSFWVLPVKLIGVVLGTILLLIAAVYIAIKLHIRRKVKQMTSHLPEGEQHIQPHDQLPHVQPVPLSKLTVVTVAVLSFTVLFLLILFVLFA